MTDSIKQKSSRTSHVKHLTPKKIVAALDRFIIGQSDAKRSVAIALRNRWRRVQLPSNIRHEIMPHNILMVGSTGIGKNCDSKASC